MRRALLIGDAVVPTGFAKMNHAYVEGLQRAGWDVHVLALNYMGDPHDRPFKAYPTATWQGGDAMGALRMPELMRRLRPDVLLVTNDPWNVAGYKARAGNCPVVASVAVDGKNCRGSELNGCAHVVFWTEFGRREAKEGGFSGRSTVVPLGVDLDVFKPWPGGVKEARKELLPREVDDAFIVGVVGRNQPRKRLDLAMMAFARWIRERDVEDAYLFLQVAPTGDAGYDLNQLAHYLGIASRVITPEREPALGMGVSEAQLRAVYGCFDVMLSAAQGEGWGLCHMEGMACGVPQIAVDWAALGEWARPASMLVPPAGLACTPNNINAIGAVMDVGLAVEALDYAYRDRAMLAVLRERGLALTAEPRYRWRSIGDEFTGAVDAAFEPREVRDGEFVGGSR